MEQNWFKIAQTNEQTAVHQQAVNAIGGDNNTLSQQSGQNQIAPAQTKTPTQNIQQGREQQAELDKIRQVTLPDIANKVLPTLNGALHFLTSEILSRDDVAMPPEAAKQLAIEIMAAWLAESRRNPVSNLPLIIVKSDRVNRVIDTIR